MKIDMRCPVNPSKLMGRVTRTDRPVISPGNLIEIACSHCKRQARAAGRDADVVVHRFNIAGEHIETEEYLHGTEVPSQR